MLGIEDAKGLPLPAHAVSGQPFSVSATKPVLLASDVHLGATPPDHRRAFLEWLRHASDEASRIFIIGDLFDFWYE